MKNNYLLLTALLLTLFTSCTKDIILDPSKEDYFIFGTYCGYCGEVGSPPTYAIANEKVFAAKTFGDSPIFQTTPLSNDKYLIASKLLKDIPASLLNIQDSVFGCPGCSDGPAIYLELAQNGKVKHWHIDTDTNVIPKELKNYVDEIQVTINQLK